MTKHMNRNALLVAYVSNSTFVEANGGGGNAQTFAQSAVVLPAFLLKRIPIGATPS